MIVLDLANAGPLVGDLRRMFRLTRAELAQLIADRRGIAARPLFASLSMWESGKRNPDTVTLAVILDVLDLDAVVAPRAARPVLADACNGIPAPGGRPQ